MSYIATDIIGSLKAKEKKNIYQHALQSQASKFLDTLSWPKLKQPGFDYVNFKPFFNSLGNDVQAESLNITKQENQIVFVDGKYSYELTDAPVHIESIDKAGMYSAYVNKKQTEALQNAKDAVVALNFSLDSFGVLIKLKKEQVLEKPISILNILTTNSDASLALRLFFHIPKNAKGLFIIKHQATSLLPFNIYTHAAIDDNAEFTLIDNLNEKSLGLHRFEAECNKSAICNLYQINPNAEFYRLDSTIKLLDEEASCSLYGLNITSQEKQAHFKACVEHHAENTRSYQHVKNLSKDRSKTSFEGKIFVDAKAQKTQAYQLNQNMVLSEKAANYSKPNLEIYADDVKASHGATFAQIDADELFYLQSRGVTKAEAEKMLVKGFLSEFVQFLPEALQVDIAKQINQSVLC